MDLSKKQRKHPKWNWIWQKKERINTKLTNNIRNGDNMKTRKNKGSTFDSFLAEEGLLEDAEATAIKKVITYELQKTMKKKHLTKRKMATQMHTSRTALDRLLDPTNTSITLTTLVKASHLLGKK